MALKITYFGNVQGVGFRFNAQACAEGLSLAGYVKNLANGSVELVVDGEEAAVTSFLAKIDTTMRGNIRQTEREHCSFEKLGPFKIERSHD